ncbi:MAG: metallophosphoesterase family protein [Candidatus Microgenomates bacterium]|jgi:putative phosphoesterase
MKILVISDSHGNITGLKHVLGFAKKIGIDVVIHAGDWNTAESVKTVLSFGIPLYTVLGNADIDPKVSEELKAKSKKFDEDFLIINLNGKNIGITHKPADNKKYFLGKKLDIIFNGHLHSRYESSQTSVKVIRPGAIIKGNNFAIYETSTNKVEFIEDV